MRTWLNAVVGLLLVGGVTAPAMAVEPEVVTLTSGIVKAVDYATGVVVLDSGRKLRVRAVIANDRLCELGEIRIDDLIFVSGIDLAAESQPSAAARTR